MKNLRLAILVGGGFLGATGILLACSSDDTVITDDAGTDGGGTPETGTEDSGVDTGTDALVDAGLTFDSFIEKMGDAYCSALSRCCFGDPDLAEGAPIDGGAAFDGGTYDRATCINLARRVGWEGSLTNADVASDAGTVVLDQAQALDCLAKVEAVSCTLSRADFVTIRSACFDALRGLGTADAPCSASVECASGFFCNGTTNKCEALRGENQPCGDFTTDNGVAEEACSWRGSGDTNRFCMTSDDAGTSIDDAGAWVCQNALPNGSFCNNSAWCAQGMCSIEQFEYICREPVTYFPREPGNCGQLVK